MFPCNEEHGKYKVIDFEVNYFIVGYHGTIAVTIDGYVPPFEEI